MLKKFNEVCGLLSLERDGLRKLMLKDPTFSKPIKLGDSKQAPVFFDIKELEQWLELKKQQRDNKANPTKYRESSKKTKRPFNVSFSRASKFIKYWVVDSLGRAWFFENKPCIVDGKFWDDKGFGYCIEAPLFDFNGDWRESMVEKDSSQSNTLHVNDVDENDARWLLDKNERVLDLESNLDLQRYLKA